MKYARLLAPLLFMLLLACSSIDCPMDSRVEMKYKFVGENTTLTDTLSVSALLAEGKDTLLLNRIIGVDSFNLPVSYSRPEDILVFSFTPEGGPTTTDTITILKLDRPHFEAVDCNPTYFHTITQVYTTNHRIASVEIGNPNVDYDDSKAHLLLTLEAADN